MLCEYFFSLKALFSWKYFDSFLGSLGSKVASKWQGSYLIEQKMLFYKLFSSFKIIGAIKDENIKL